MSASSVDPGLFAGFLDESLESLDDMDRVVLGLADGGRDPDALTTLFRPVHSLKGNAGFFRLMQIRRLAHAMENVLDDLRTNRMACVPTETLLRSLDMLRRLLRSCNGGTIPPDDPEADSLVSELAHVRELDAVLVAKRSGCDAGIPASLARLLAMLEAPVTRVRPREEAAGLLSLLAELEALAPQGGVAKSVLAECGENARTLLSALGYDPILNDILREKLVPLNVPSAWKPPPSEAKPDAATGNQAESGAVERTMRVPERSIDAFLGYVGELIVVEEVFQHLNRMASSGASGLGEEFVRRLKQNTDTFSSLSRELRMSILRLRRVPARILMQKAPRLAHDVATKQGKKVRVILSGEDVEIDKSHLELLDAPLTHMVNNAVDHGLEEPDRRTESGKDPEGLLAIGLSEQDDRLVLEVRDDGRGLDLDAIARRAVSMGLASPGQPIGQAEIVQFLFMPGFSTATAVTEVSGRGVGMDVVHSRIHEAGGRVEVESEPGRGCLFRIILPQSVRTQIIDGFVARVGECFFLFPLPLVGEVFPLDGLSVHDVPGKGRVIAHGGTILPLVRLGHLLESNSSAEDGIVVTTTLESGVAALLVDEVLGIHKTVVKPLGAVGLGGKLYEGVGMMGDGSMALILGASGLACLAREDCAHGHG